jgi:hypothetical protein
MTEGNFPCSAIFLEGLPKMEVSPSLVGGRLVLDDVDVGVLVGTRQRCRTSKGEDALITLGDDSEVVVVVAVASSWWCLSHGLLLCS